LEEIRAERRAGAAISNVSGFIFTNQDGKPITKGQLEYQSERAIRLTGVRKFVFHNYRNTALTHRARHGVDVDIAMLANGHSSVPMHKRYVDLQQQDIAKSFGTAGPKVATEMATRKQKVTVSS
jgi:integrase